MSYSETLMDHFTEPRNQGPMADADRIGTAGSPGRGPFLVVYLKLAGDEVAAASFQTYGCGATIAAGSVLTELIEGQPIARCLALTADDIINALDGVPATKLHAPDLAVRALRLALTH